MDKDAKSAVRIESYRDEDDLPMVMKLIEKELSEPYHIYTYRYFLHDWPHLSFLAWADSEPVGVVVCKLDRHMRGARLMRGYIAMLSVDPHWRGRGIATKLVAAAVGAMQSGGAHEVVLETEVTNSSALRLYENRGFIREKRLYRFYLNGNDAFRLVLPITQPQDMRARTIPLNVAPARRPTPPPLPPRQPFRNEQII